MLFNSYIFIFVFLPITVFGYYYIGRRGHYNFSIFWLVVASLVFYAYWNPIYLSLILGSIVFNYLIGASLSLENARHKRIKLAFGVFINLSIIGYFKYANFLVDNIVQLFAADFVLNTIILPLAISFFTFQQIAFLVDAYRGETKELNFLHYLLFVTFFPQLIAGPIVHHKEMLPQFARNQSHKINHKKILAGLSIFSIGLFKKVVVADGIAQLSTPVFDAAVQSDSSITFIEGWAAALGYTFQLYFDFSGYSDMAIGLALLFGIQLPINFNSPYKASSIIDFWRRWHMTLSRFLRDYLYIPLGGSRKGRLRQYVNLLITMLIGGLWHGAGWTFIIWGGLHGFYLLFNYFWRRITSILKVNYFFNGVLGKYFGMAITFVVVVIAWVIFRTENVDSALRIYQGMSGYNGIVFPSQLERIIPGVCSVFECSPYLNEVFGQVNKPYYVLWLPVLLLWVWFAPNVKDLCFNINENTQFPYLRKSNEVMWWHWRPGIISGAIAGGIAFISVLHLTKVSEFLYFQF